MKSIHLKLSILSSLLGVLGIFLLLSLSDGFVWADTNALEVEKTAEQILKSKDFKQTLNDFKKSCHQTIRLVQVSGENDFLAGSGILILNAKSLLDYKYFFADLFSDCESIQELVDLTNTSLAKAKKNLKIIVPVADIIKGTATYKDILKWTTLFDEKISTKELQFFRKSCLMNSGFDTLVISDQNLILGNKIMVKATDNIKKFSDINSWTNSCGVLMSELTKLSIDVSLKYGLFFHFEAQDFLANQYSEESVLNWVDYFKKNESALTRFRQLVLDKTEKTDFVALKKCLKNGKDIENCYVQNPINVRVSDFNGYDSVKIASIGGLFTSFISMLGVNTEFGLVLLGDQDAASRLDQASISRIKKAMQETTVYLDVTQKPGLMNEYL